MKKVFASLAIIIAAFIFSSSIVSPVFATMPVVYPVYGYNAVHQICQVKQASESDEINQDLDGSYWNLRDCRSAHPEILFFTGRGIVLWPILFVSILLNHFFVLPRVLKTRSALEKKVGVIWDSLLISFTLFILVLFKHFFSIPDTSYQYGSDIDRIIYGVFIDDRIAIMYTLAYLFVSAAAVVILKKMKVYEKK